MRHRFAQAYAIDLPVTVAVSSIYQQNPASGTADGIVLTPWDQEEVIQPVFVLTIGVVIAPAPAALFIAIPGPLGHGLLGRVADLRVIHLRQLAAARSVPRAHEDRRAHAR
jgi:hypothetical protein